MRLASSARILAPHLPTSPAHLPAPALAGRKVWEIRTGAIAYSRRPLHCCWTDADAADGWTRGELPSRRRRRRHHPLIAAPSRQLNSRLRARRARATNWIHLFPFSSNCNCSSNLQPKRGKSFADRLRHMARATGQDAHREQRNGQNGQHWPVWPILPITLFPLGILSGRPVHLGSLVDTSSHSGTARAIHCLSLLPLPVLSFCCNL